MAAQVEMPEHGGHTWGGASPGAGGVWEGFPHQVPLALRPEG